MDHFVHSDNAVVAAAAAAATEREKKEHELKSRVAEEADLEEEDDEAEAEQICRELHEQQQNEPAVKEISAPYTVPHYPIEVEEQKKIAVQHFVLKELEERATLVDADGQGE